MTQLISCISLNNGPKENMKWLKRRMGNQEICGKALVAALAVCLILHTSYSLPGSLFHHLRIKSKKVHHEVLVSKTEVEVILGNSYFGMEKSQE
ncbi:uncharacterized protein LOC144283253 isoform X3 [Canis aureus]